MRMRLPLTHAASAIMLRTARMMKVQAANPSANAILTTASVGNTAISAYQQVIISNAPSSKIPKIAIPTVYDSPMMAAKVAASKRVVDQTKPLCRTNIFRRKAVIPGYRTGPSVRNGWSFLYNVSMFQRRAPQLPGMPFARSMSEASASHSARSMA